MQSTHLFSSLMLDDADRFVLAALAGGTGRAALAIIGVWAGASTVSISFNMH
ncbi:MAG: hypothetical protein OXC60_14735 [Litoreibacter sp.]|nr:hypothetical protein [Litoreibacter sp.]